MQRERIAFLLFAATLVSAFFIWRASGVQVRFENGRSIEVEVVSEPLEVATGLMFREKLDEGEGVLFSYGYDDYHSIWMKNMMFPIDIVWMDSTGLVLWVAQDIKPCTREPCEVYAPPERARYVLEVNANITRENNVTIGQRVSISQPSIF